MHSEGFLSGGLGAGSCFTRPRAFASVRGVSAWAWLLIEGSLICLKRLRARRVILEFQGHRSEAQLVLSLILTRLQSHLHAV